MTQSEAEELFTNIGMSVEERFQVERERQRQNVVNQQKLYVVNRGLVQLNILIVVLMLIGGISLTQADKARELDISLSERVFMNGDMYKKLWHDGQFSVRPSK